MRPEILYPLFADTNTLKGVGAKVKSGLNALCGETILDILWHIPRDIIEYKITDSIAECIDGQNVIIQATVGQHISPARYSKSPYKVWVFDSSDSLSLVYFRASSKYMENLLPVGDTVYICGKIDSFGDKKQITHPENISKSFSSIDKTEIIYPQSASVNSRQFKKIVTQALDKVPDLAEWLPADLMKKMQFSSFRNSLLKLHNPASEKDLDLCSKHRKRLAYDELFANQLTIAINRMRTVGKKAIPLVPTGHLESTVLENLPFTLTSAQQRSIADIKKDIAQTKSMNRLLQGDVGSGKTIVAVCSMITAIESNAQSILLVPTEILAQQHFTSITKHMDKIGIKCILLTGRLKGKKRTEALQAIAAGQYHVIIGTHAVFQPDVLYHNVGLTIIDEQHRFGVEQRLALASKGQSPHILAMSATPIPRTLLMTVFGDMDISLLDEKPQGRKPIDTRILSKEKIDTVVQGLRRILNDGTQVYWVCPLVSESEVLDFTAVEQRYEHLCDVFGDDVVALVHGKMNADEKDLAMQRFIDGNAKILVATTVIEVGVDVPNASVIIIEQAERFGLSQLHQLRGRVGRGNTQSVCILLYGHLTQIARKRLEIMRQTEDGFMIAENDLQLRGPGDVLGTRQSGYPKMKIANMIEDQDLLQTARKHAQLIMETDKDLQTDMGKNLRVLLYLFHMDKAIKNLQQ